jgi:serine/threonine protein kinase
MAPETLSSQTFPASDVWAAGIMAYQLLSGGRLSFLSFFLLLFWWGCCCCGLWAVGCLSAAIAAHQLLSDGWAEQAGQAQQVGHSKWAPVA